MAQARSSVAPFPWGDRWPGRSHGGDEPARKLAARPAIDTEMLMDTYRKLSVNGRAVTPRVFGTELSIKMPNYKKGHRTLENFLRNSGVFKIEDGVIRPLD